LREAKRRGHPTLAIVNTVGSTIARESDGGIYLHAGPEVGVASTKAFSAQVTVLLLLALHLARLKHLSFQDGMAVVEAIESIPSLLGEVLKTEALIEQAARLVAGSKSALYLGRDIHYPVALEGALKLKEISYIHAAGYPTAEMKHGPIALVADTTPSISFAPHRPLHPTTPPLRQRPSRTRRKCGHGEAGSSPWAAADLRRSSRPGNFSCRFRVPPRSFSRYWPWYLFNCWPIMWRFSSAAISTSRAIW